MLDPKDLGKIYKEGNLQKLSPSKFRGWQTRSFRLYASCLMYSEPKAWKPKDKQCLELCFIDSVSNKGMLLDVVARKRIYKMKAASETEAMDWVEALKAALPVPQTAKLDDAAALSQEQGIAPSLSFAPPLKDQIAAPRGGVFIVEDTRPVWDVYEQLGRLGSGAFGIVFRAKEKETGKTVAVKRLEIPDSNTTLREQAFAEFHMAALVSHPHIMRVFAYFKSSSAVFIVSELASGGELLDYMAKNPELAAENGIAQVTKQVLSALTFLHTEKMLHHDVKPANILVTEHMLSIDPKVPVVVLSDFGTARLCTTNGVAAGRRRSVLGTENLRSKRCSITVTTHADVPQSADDEIELRGTPEYCGPEVFAGKSGDRTDIYALGVTLFELLTGEKPFELQYDLFDDSGADRFHEMKCESHGADWTRMRGVSPEGVALVKRMMVKEYDKRPSALQCSQDKWFEVMSKPNGRTASQEEFFLEEAAARLERMKKRARLCFFGKSLLNMMAAQLSGEHLQKEREIFAQLDKDGSGCVEVQELLEAFEKNGWDKNKAELALKHFDIDCSGSLQFNQWVAATMELETQNDAGLHGRVESLFSSLDRDGDGGILLDELLARFGTTSPEEKVQLQAFFNELDEDGNGSISLSEFKTFWKSIA